MDVLAFISSFLNAAPEQAQVTLRAFLIGCLSAVPWTEGGPPGQELLPDPRSDGEVRNLHQPAGGELPLQAATWRVPGCPVHL